MNKVTMLACVVALGGCKGISSVHEGVLAGPGTTYPASRFNYLLYAGDVTGDGEVDLFVASQALERNVVSVLVGDGDGGFVAPLQFDITAPSEMVSGDFQGDGFTDIAGVSYDGMGGLGMFLLQGDGHGGFTLSRFAQPLHYWSGSLGSADFTGDGLPDLVAPYQDDDPSAPGGVSILAAPDFTEVADMPVDALEFNTFLAVGDFDADGNADVVVSTTQNGTRPEQLALLRGDGAGHLGAPTFFEAATTNTRPVVADFNRDGALDVALVDSDNVPGTERVVVLLGDGHGGLGAPHEFSTELSSHFGARGLAAGDLDRDHLIDLVVGAGAPHLTVMHGDGAGGFRACDHLALPLGEAWSVAAADFDDNGSTDVAAVTTDVPIAVFLNR